MNDPKDKDTGSKDPDQTAASPGPADTTGSDKRSGRITYDERGNSVWEWQLETGVYSRDVSTQKLKKLELDELSIAETATNRSPPGLEPEQPQKLPGGGFNPYDNSSAANGAGANPYDNARALGKKFATPQEKSTPRTTPAPRKPPDLQKLEEWMKLKKRVQEAKDRGDDDE